MTVLLAMRGLPGSGKTYNARRWVAEDRANRVRVNRDDIRMMLDEGDFIKGTTEIRVIKARDALISMYLRKGLDVVCDDTNLPSRIIRDLQKLAAKEGAEFQVLDLTDVDLTVCQQRNSMRNGEQGHVPPSVIIDMHNRFVKGKEYPLPVPELPANEVSAGGLYVPKPKTFPAVLVDIDGTIADRGMRSPFDEDRVSGDQPHWDVIKLIQSLQTSQGVRVVFLSGRSLGCFEATKRWLDFYYNTKVNYYDHLYMRQSGDNRKDSIVKLELFDKYIRDDYNVKYVFDDRDQVVEMWRSIGLRVLQVAPGTF